MGDSLFAQDENLLLGVFCVQLQRISPTQLAEAAAAWATDPAKDLGLRLVEMGALDSADHELIRNLVEQAVRNQGGNARDTLDAFGGADVVNRTFRGSIVVSEAGNVTNPIGGVTKSDIVSLASSFGVDEVKGRYGRESEHARGGMGRVLIVHDNFIGRDIALKELLPDIAEGDIKGTPNSSISASARFLREARITGKLEHPSIVPVYELGRRLNGALYYTMKFVRGKSLKAAIADAGSLAERMKLLPHYVDLCLAIAYAHDHGVIHRDIKPDNVMVGEFGETLVIDWGIAKAVGDPSENEQNLEDTLGLVGEEANEGYMKTAYGFAMGTAAYMAPEQAKGQLDLIDERSDVYGLGVVLYELLTGRAPFERGSASDIIEKVISEDPPDVSSLEPAAPYELTAVVNRAMAKSQDQRYQSAKDLAADVQRFQSGALVMAHEYGLPDLVAKYVRKHAPIFTTAAIALIALAAFGTYSFVNVYQARQEAVAAKRETERALGRAERGLYHASIQLAVKRIEEGAEGLARSALGNAPEALRNWEWGHLVMRAYPDSFIGPDSDDDVYDPEISVAKNWTGMFGRMALSLQGHEAEINSIAFDSLGGRMITAAADATARIWNVETGELIQVIRKTSDIIQCANFSPDGLKVVTASTYSASADIWNASTGEHLVGLEGHGRPINQARFAPDGRRVLTVSADNTGRIWDAHSGRMLLELDGHEAMLMDGFFSSDGARIYTAAVDGTVGVWDADSGELVRFLERDDPELSVSVQMSPEHYSVVSAFPDGSSAVWNGASRATTILQDGRVGKLDYAGFSFDDSAVVAPDKERGALIWDASTGNVVAHVGQQQGRLLSAAFSPDGSKIITGGIDGSLRIWMPGEVVDRGRLAAHDDVLYRADFSPDGKKIVAASYDGTASVWDTETRQLLGRLEGHDSELLSAFFSADGERIATTSWTETKFWDAQTLRELPIQLERSPGRLELGIGGPRSEFALVIQALISNPISPDGRFFVAPHAGTFRVWRTDTGRLQTSFSGFESPTGSFAFSHGASLIVTTGRAGEMAVWECETGRIVSRARSHLGNVSTFAFSRDDTRILSASIDQTARLWDVHTGEDLVAFEGHSSIIVCARFNPDETKVVTASGDGTAAIWDAKTGERLVVMKGLVGSVINAQFSPDGSRVLTMSLETATLWDLEGRELLTLGSGEDALLTHAQWSPGGDRILTCYRDGTAKLWDSFSWEQLKAFGNFDDSIEDRLRAMAESGRFP